MRSKKKLISIVVPTHNEVENIAVLYRRILVTLKKMNYRFEVIFVDDSQDGTPEAIHKLIEENKNVTIVRLTRSFGQTAAISAGLEIARGCAVVMMDADLQDPPEAIPLFISEWERGASVVYAKRASSGVLIYRVLANLFYRIQRSLSQTPIPANAGEFRLIDDRVLNFVRNLPEQGKYLRGQTLWPGFASTGIEITREDRLAGKTKYNFSRSLSVAKEGLISFSVKPLKLALNLSFFVSVLIVLLALIFIVYRNLSPESFSAGWAGLFITILTMAAINLLTIGILGEYIGAIYQEVLKRPRYLIDYVYPKRSKISDGQK